MNTLLLKHFGNVLDHLSLPELNEMKQEMIELVDKQIKNRILIHYNQAQNAKFKAQILGQYLDGDSIKNIAREHGLTLQKANFILESLYAYFKNYLYEQNGTDITKMQVKPAYITPELKEQYLAFAKNYHELIASSRLLNPDLKPLSAYYHHGLVQDSVLSNRTKLALARFGFDTLAELGQVSYKQLLNLPCFGQKKADEVRIFFMRLDEQLSHHPA